MFGKRRQLPMIFQTESSECGLACLAMATGYFGFNISIAALRTVFPVSLKGLSLRDLMGIATKVGFASKAMRCEVSSLKHLSRPTLLHWDLQHFVVLKSVTRNRFVIHDPSRGIRVLTATEVSNHFTGIVLTLEPSLGFQKLKREKGLTIGNLLGSFQGFKPSVIQVLLLSAFLELLVLTQPVFIRTIVDVGVDHGDMSFIYKVVAVLALAAALLGLTNFLRDFAVLRAGTTLNFSMMQRIFRHLMRLPLPFFEKRPIGHLIERYRVTDEIERFLVSNLPLALIDGLMTLLSLSLIFLVSVKLGLLSLLTFGLFLLFKSLGYRVMRSREQELLHAKGEESGYLIETLKCIFSTKVNALEDNRYFCWTNYYANLIDAQRKYGLVALSFRSLKLTLVGLNTTLLILITGRSLVLGTMTTGTLLGLLFYNGHFIMRATNLVDRFFDFLFLKVRLERLEDIVLTEPERNPAAIEESLEKKWEAGNQLAPFNLRGGISIEDLSFRYSAVDPPILKEVSCRIASGEFVALVGENGAGKTTLLKLLLGLYSPDSGKILYDGHDLEDLDLGVLRGQISTVTQNDQLFTGTVTDNISLFDPDVALEAVAHAAKLACIHEDIEKMPMGYSTRVGDLGSPFSEGQKQKIFLARALYKRPRILIMDEGTANLDGNSEIQVLNNLERLSITKILIAHRSASIIRAHRVMLLQEGRLKDISGERWKLSSVQSA